jgi:N-acetylglucosaminyl-diphospho-decaprenol L-rhamnosyltransferase
MDVSIVVVSYNTCNLLDECIFSINKETSLAYEIIVVDNGSTDNSCQMLREKYPEVILIENRKNVGFARANNQGFWIAKGKYFFMLNPDTLILAGAIDKLVSFMKENHNVGICGPRNIGRDGKLQYNCDHFPSFWNTLFYYAALSRIFPKSSLFNRRSMAYWDYGEVRNVERIVGCSLMIRSELYKELNGLDENYFMYFEETDFCYRAYQKGVKITLMPFAEIIHYGGESAIKRKEEFISSNTITAQLFESQYYFYRKNYGYLSEIFIRLLDLTYGLFFWARNKLRKDKHRKFHNVSLGKLIIRSSLDLDYKRVNNSFSR